MGAHLIPIPIKVILIPMKAILIPIQMILTIVLDPNHWSLQSCRWLMDHRVDQGVDPAT